MNIIEEIRAALFACRDEKFREFHTKLIPTVPSEKVIGVRTPQLRRLAKQYAAHEQVEEFLNSLPHAYYEEDQLHSFILCEIKNFSTCLEQVERFLPFVDNWATCDQLSPKVFRKNAEDILPYIFCWLRSEHAYTIRFGVDMLMQHFLDSRFEPEHLNRVAQLCSGEYYIDMAIAWYFATALAKQYEATLPVLQQRQLSVWCHNKTIQKAVESYRITNEQKTYLKTLKVKSAR